MKKIIILLLIFTLSYIQSFGQSNCDIINHYNDFIQIQKLSYEGVEYLEKRVVTTERKSCFSDIINSNILIIDYLLSNFSSDSNYDYLIKLNDSLELSKVYISELKNDSLFNSVMTELVSKVIEKKIPKDTISRDKLLNVAVKFFSISSINEEGNYAAKVCAGLNDIKQTEKVRKPFIEAFCFTSILKHYQSEEFSMYDEFVKSIKELYKLNLGIDKNDRLLRAQGAMFILMRNNENLIKMLKSEYDRNKESLPFVFKVK